MLSCLEALSNVQEMTAVLSPMFTFRLTLPGGVNPRHGDTERRGTTGPGVTTANTIPTTTMATFQHTSTQLTPITQPEILTTMSTHLQRSRSRADHLKDVAKSLLAGRGTTNCSPYWSS